MDKTEIMKRTIELARMKMHDDGYWPFGCVIIKDGEVVGKGCNNMPLANDPTGHGEIVAIRDACKRLGTMDLSGCELYMFDRESGCGRRSRGNRLRGWQRRQTPQFPS